MSTSDALCRVTYRIQSSHIQSTGCLPIYMGAPNFLTDFAPDPKSVIIYDPATMTPESLAGGPLFS